MTEVILLPYIEKLLVDFLADQPEIATLVADRVYTELPETKVWPLIRLHQFNSLRPTTRARWLATTVVQIDAYGGTKNIAHRLAQTCAGVLDARLTGTHDEGVVTGIVCYGLRDEPDETFESARPRWLFLAEITAHP